MKLRPGDLCRYCSAPATALRDVHGVEIPVCERHVRYLDGIADRAPSTTATGEHLDFTNPHDVARWLVDLRDAFEDLRGVASDLLMPPRQRQFGHVEHQRIYGESYGTIRWLLRHAVEYGPPPPDDDDEPMGGDSPH